MKRKKKVRMLRTAATHLRRQVNVVRSSSHNNRTMITSAQKRALKNEQIKGGESSKSSAKPPIAGASPAATAEAGGGGGGGGSSLPLLAGVGIAGAGAAYYMDVLPLDMIMGKKAEEEKADDSIVSVSEAAVEKEEADLSIAIAEEEVAAKAVEVVVEEKKEEEPVVVVVEEKKTTGNRVLQITAPSGSGRVTEPLPEVSHVEGGNRVSVAKFAGGDAGKETPAPTTDAPTGEIAAQAEDELKMSSLPGKSAIDEELARAHASMKASVDESYLKNLDDLSPSDLRIKIVQLTSEMSERTKWEAVRLREFLSMKEKEVGDK